MIAYFAVFSLQITFRTFIPLLFTFTLIIHNLFVQFPAGTAVTASQNLEPRNSISDEELYDNEIDDSSFAESFCWAVGNLANHDGGFRPNQMKLIELGKKCYTSKKIFLSEQRESVQMYKDRNYICYVLSINLTLSSTGRSLF